MRTPTATVTTALSLALIGCSSGGMVVVRQPPPAPAPVPVMVMEPLEIDVARPHNGKVFVQTNRPAYVAIFEIVPDRGVALVYPQSPRQRRFVVSGLRELPVWWQASRVTYSRGSPSRSHPERYIYAIASDEPLRIPDAAFHDGSLDEMIGNRSYRARNPYATMRALARELVPSVAEEAWAEDVHSLSPSYATERYRVARVYCGGGTVYEVPAELADRVWCPPPPRGGARGPGRFSDDVDLPGSRRPLVRPDSMVGDNGRRVAMRPHGSNGRGPVDRVKAPPGEENRGGSDNENGNGNDDRPGRGNGPTKNHPDNRPDARPVQPNEERDDKPRPPRGAGMNDAKPPRAHPTPIPTPVDRPEPADNKESAGKPQNTDGRESSPKPETAGQPERPPKTEGPTKPEHSSKPDGSAKPAVDDESKPGSKAEPKAQPSAEKGGESKAEPSGDKGGEPKKGRGQADSADEKPAGGKSKRPEAKPTTPQR